MGIKLLVFGIMCFAYSMYMVFKHTDGDSEKIDMLFFNLPFEELFKFQYLGLSSLFFILSGIFLMVAGQ
jgi:hypothetical protein